MATIISWSNNEGTKGRCDARCHNAKHDKCKCICGGTFHGKARQPGGVEKVIEDKWGEVAKVAEQYAQANGAEIKTKLPFVLG